MLQLHSSPAGSRKGGRGVSSGPEFQFKQQAVQPKGGQSQSHSRILFHFIWMIFCLIVFELNIQFLLLRGQREAAHWKLLGWEAAV